MCLFHHWRFSYAFPYHATFAGVSKIYLNGSKREKNWIRFVKHQVLLHLMWVCVYWDERTSLLLHQEVSFCSNITRYVMFRWWFDDDISIRPSICLFKRGCVDNKSQREHPLAHSEGPWSIRKPWKITKSRHLENIPIRNPNCLNQMLLTQRSSSSTLSSP